jgi:hypothetical protein
MIDPLPQITQELWYLIVIGVLASAALFFLVINSIVDLVKRSKSNSKVKVNVSSKDTFKCPYCNEEVKKGVEFFIRHIEQKHSRNVRNP